MSRTHDRSCKIFEASQQLMPGGVNSPARAFRAVGGEPIVFAYGRGPRVWDEWRGASSQLINHYGLNLGLPEHRAQLRNVMKEFLGLEPA